ncbi:MAG TPA: NfeD family protein [Gammaproteobacteria bacterium]|nr:NfeD family protein [Gammaproteobacteria bacterium]
MCHLILLLPIIALPVFWLWSWPIAVSVYAAVLLFSGWTYMYAMFAMRRPVVTGVEYTLHSRGVVVDDAPEGLRVRVNSEYWPAECDRPLHTGDAIRVVGREGLTLIVEPLSAPDAPNAAAGHNASRGAVPHL